MKFSHTLSLNSNPDWAKHYIDYAGLKKLINETPNAPTTQQEQEQAQDASQEVGLSEDDGVGLPPTPAIDSRQNMFLDKLMEDVTHVREFYYKTLVELNREMGRLKPVLEKSASALDLASLAAESEETSLLSPRKLKSLTKLQLGKNDGTDTMKDMEELRREICDLFTQYHNLQTYASLNCTAVQKILKKYDKSMNTSLKTSELESFKVMLPFWDGTPEIDTCIGILKQYFAHFFCNDDEDEALRRMKLMIRELVSFQRRSVWLDVIQDQRRHESAQVVLPASEQPSSSKAIGMVTHDVGMKKIPAQLGQILCSSGKVQFGLFSFILFVGILISPDVFPQDPTKRNALAMLIFVSLLWAAEVFPLFVTAMLVPFLAVTLQIVVVDGVRLDATAASKFVFDAMFSHVIMLLIGGFSIAAALSKHNIAKVLASSIAIRCGSGIRIVLLVNMFVATIASMWISNVAAPVLCFSLVAPILKAATVETSRAPFGTKQHESAERDYRLCRALVMGIALASNVGGMASPISSPQNLFAIEQDPIGWLAWFTVSIPLCITLNIILWAWLVFCFELPSANSSAVEQALNRSRSSTKEHFTPTQYFVTIVSAGVVMLWCANVDLESVTGQMGVLGIVPFILFFGTNVLTKEDLNNFLWSVVVLAMGGLVLGATVESSGLLDVIAESIATLIEAYSLSLWLTMCTFTLLILVCTTFVSHTVGAIVVLPILHSIGSRMEPTSHAKELVFAGAIACSAAMGLPVSGFPNMTAVNQEDHLGNRFLLTADFLRYAVPASLISWVIVTTLGYSLILVAIQIDE